MLDKINHMTHYGLVNTSNISYFKAHLSQELRAVRNGERIIILDRDIPVAEVMPYAINKKNKDTTSYEEAAVL